MDTSLDHQECADELGAYQPLRFERRQRDRWGMEGVATAFELGGEGFGRMHTLKLQDYSDGIWHLEKTPVSMADDIL